MQKKCIGIIGAGSVGLAMAAEYALNDYTVLLGEVEGFTDRLPVSGKIMAEGVMFTDHRVDHMRTVDVKVVHDYHEFNQHNCQAVFVVTTAHPHEVLLPRLDSVLNAEIPIIVICGNGSVPGYIQGERIVVETNTAPYGVRVVEANEKGTTLSFKILTPRFGLSGKQSHVENALAIVTPVYPEAFAFDHKLDALFSNPNPLMHVSIMLANLASLDPKTPFTFYDQGVSDSVLKIIKQKDNERKMIAQAAGLTPLAFDDMEGVIHMQGQLITQHFIECGSLSQILAPQDPVDRYFTEDVPFGLCAWEAIAKHHQIVTPIISSEINMVCVVLGENYRHLSLSRNEKILASLLG